MTSIDCDEYVDMGEHNKPLCKKSGYRPAECELCPTRMASLEAENAKLREHGARLFDKTLELGTENEKLREERDHWRVEQVHAYGNWEDTYKRASELEAENAKLRNLLQRTWDAFHNATAREFVTVKNELRELGVEVDG